MTIVCMMLDGNAILSIADSGGFCDDTVRLRKDAKTFVKDISGLGRIMVGFCGGFNIGQWFHYGLEWPTCEDAHSSTFAEHVERYLVKTLLPRIAKSLHKRFFKRGISLEDTNDWNVIVGVPNCGVFTLYPNGDVEKAWDPDCSALPHACIGSGAAVAYIAVAASKKNPAISTWDILQHGVQAAYENISSIRPPYDLKYLMA
jgi:hypothetical protein